MTRPAIIIGLGGTGQWILTYLKKDLLEIGEGQMPPGVKLLCFDTTTKPMAGVGKLDDKERQTATEIKLGSVKLEQDTEFIPIGDNVYDLARAIRDGQEDASKQKHPHLASWFDADDMLRRHARMTFNLAEGSGQIRQFGRMAIFNDLSKGPLSKIRAHLQAAVRKLRTEVSGQRQLEVILIASFAGGTGAGMFVDMGVLARHEASKLVEKNLCLRGIYILPRVFDSQNTEMNARAFAAWRELDRFLMIGQKYGQRKMIYSPTDHDLQISINERIFDACYIVDAVGAGLNSLENIAPEHGLFPMVSDVVSTILDTKAGQDYTQYITTNLAGKLDSLPRAPYHSAIGAFTLKVPVYFDLQVYAHQFALDVLTRFLRPLRDVENKRVIGVANDANEEKPNYSGRRAALEFLRVRNSADFGLVGDEKTNTSFTPVVADIREGERVNDNALIQRVAMMNLSALQRASEANLYFAALVNVGEDDAGKKLKKDVETELYLPLTKEVPPSRVAKDLPGAAFLRIQKRVPLFITEHYGQKLSDGTEKRGKYGEALQKCEQYQVERFRDILYLWLGATLNGTVDDLERARSGKIGYVLDTLKEISASFGDYVEFFNKVRAERTERLTKLHLDAAVSNAFSQYQRHKDDRCIFNVFESNIHPRAFMTQNAYLQAEQVRIDHRKYDILLSILVETATAMRTLCEDTLVKIENWVDYLATGDAEKQIEGLYQSVENSLDLAQANHFLDKSLEKVQQLLGERPYQADEEKIRQILGRLEWQVSLEDGLMKIGLNATSLRPDGKKTVKEFHCGGANATEGNLRLILSMGEAVYADLPKQAPLIKMLVDTYPLPDTLADAVNRKAEPLYETSTIHNDPKLVSCYVRIDVTNLEQGREQAEQYMKEFVERLSTLNPMAVETEYRLLPSDNKYRMTIMRSDDLLLSEGFNMWHICSEAYQQLIVKQRIPAERFHIYPAERNAAFYEQEIYTVLKPETGYRTLHPSVVALLEDRSAAEYFLLCLAYGFIRKEKVGVQEVFMLELPESRRSLHLSRLSDDPQLYRPPDLLEVMDTFVNKGSAIDNDQLYIDMAKVRKAVQTRLDEIGADGAVERLKFQLDNPAGIVKTLWEKVERERGDLPPAEKRYVAVEYEDLADLSTVVYKRSIGNLEGLSIGTLQGS